MIRKKSLSSVSLSPITLAGFLLITAFVFFNKRPGNPSEATGTTGASDEQS